MLTALGLFSAQPQRKQLCYRIALGLVLAASKSVFCSPSGNLFCTVDLGMVGNSGEYLLCGVPLYLVESPW